MNTEIAMGVRDELPPKFIVIFLWEHGIIGVTSREGIANFICSPFSTAEKAKSYIESVGEVLGYKGYIYEMREVDKKSVCI